VLTQILPLWALDGGAGALMARLSNTAERARIARKTDAHLAWDWRDILISAVGSGAGVDVVGRTIAELAADSGRTPVEAALDLLAAERGAVNMISFNQCEENLRQTLSHPLPLIISDGFYVKGRPHPRLWGTFPRLLGTFVANRSCLRSARPSGKSRVRPRTGSAPWSWGGSKRARLQTSPSSIPTKSAARQITTGPSSHPQAFARSSGTACRSPWTAAFQRPVTTTCRMPSVSQAPPAKRAGAQERLFNKLNY
jgi:hypothetical protein